MRLQELVTLHTKENILAEATTIKYHSVVSIFIKDTNINLVSSIDHETILNWRDNILNRSSAGNWNKRGETGHHNLLIDWHYVFSLSFRGNYS
jgi:hypothetical protein